MKIKFADLAVPTSGSLVIFSGQGGKLGAFGQKIDEMTDGQVARAIKVASFTGKNDQALDIIAPSGLELSRLFVVGTHGPDGLEPVDFEYAGATARGALADSADKAAFIAVDVETGQDMHAEHIAALIASGALLRGYSFDKYKSATPDDKTKTRPILKSLTVMTADPPAARLNFRPFEAVSAGVMLARDLVNEPANVLTPKTFAGRTKALEKLGVAVDILESAQLKKLGMNALLAVGKGSANESRVAIMRWNGAGKNDKPVAFVGKGVTFDSGGLSIKPAANMHEMKGDMGGAACVTGLMHALAARKAGVNAVGIVGLVENMPGGKAQRPGDIITSLSGQTIEVQNTDAEGRLVLADLLWYTQNRFKPKFMIDLATLTGAILIALGKEHAGLFASDDTLADRLIASSLETREKVWRMPLTAEYDKLIDCDVADMKNVGGRLAGSITAGQFLQRFVNKTPWVHLDIAGVAMGSKKTPLNQGWASGWGVRLLNRFLLRYYEK
ncbi:MAG: leucyl aminopeptidase [Hyphomicrobiales bacterium]